jgi:hypothetical protein
VAHPEKGIFCFSARGFAPQNAVATIDIVGSAGAMVAVSVGQQATCPAGTQVTAVTTDHEGKTGNFGFYLSVD